MPLSEERALQLLDAMLADMAAQSELHQPSPFWRGAVEQIAAELRRDGFARFRSLPGPRSYFVPSYGPPGNGLSAEHVDSIEALLLESVEHGSKAHLSLVDLLRGYAWARNDYRVLVAGDREDTPPDLTRVSESATGRPSEGFEFAGRRFSRSMLNYLHGLAFLKQVLGTVPVRSVLEVGGGFGTLGEIVHTFPERWSYVDVDIPPTAAVASYYLSHLEGVSCSDYLDTREESTLAIPEPGTQLVICPWQLPRLEGTVDLLWNFISFQEMEPPIVKFYLQEGARLGCRYVLLRNLREGKERRSAQRQVGVDDPVQPVHYDAYLEGYDLLATNVHPFGYQTVDGFHSELRLYERA